MPRGRRSGNRTRIRDVAGGPRAKRRRNDAGWRVECLAARGGHCRVCCAAGVEIDHLIPRAQGGPSVVENGLPLCPPHHEAKTRHQLKIRRSWLDPDQLAWLADRGDARWLADGTVVGRHCRLFEDDEREAR